MSPYKRHPQVLVALIMLHSAQAMATIGMATSSHILRVQGILHHHRSQAFVATRPLTDYITITKTKHSPLFSANPAVTPPTTTTILTSNAGSTAVAAITSHVKQQLLNFRGGSSTEFGLTRIIKGAMHDVAGSKTKSWMVLFVAVLVETFAASLSKRARQMGNPKLFAFSLSLNFIRYVVVGPMGQFFMNILAFWMTY